MAQSELDLQEEKRGESSRHHEKSHDHDGQSKMKDPWGHVDDDPCIAKKNYKSQTKIKGRNRLELHIMNLLLGEMKNRVQSR